jgi:hypothetical protein
VRPDSPGLKFHSIHRRSIERSGRVRWSRDSLIAQDVRLKLHRVEIAVQKLVDTDPLLFEKLRDEQVIAEIEARALRVELAIASAQSHE